MRLDKRIITAGAVFAAALMLSLTAGEVARAAEGTVAASNVKVRASASTSSEQVSSVTTGDVVDIVGEETDSSGYTWYKIFINDSEYGYVRSDLVQRADGAEPTAADAASDPLPQTDSAAVEMRYATVIAEKRANIRGGAGTTYDSVGTVSNGDQLVVIGQAAGSDGKTWYQVQLGDGSTGYIREDLIALGDIIPQETPEQSEPAETSQDTTESAGSEGRAQISAVGNGEYSLAYKADENGLDTWYLYDNVESTQVKLSDLLTAAGNGEAAARLLKSNSTLKIVLVILVVVIVALVIICILLIYRLRDSLYYEGDDEAYERRSSSYEELTPPRMAGGQTPKRARRESDSQAAAGKQERAPRQDSAPGRASQSEGAQQKARPVRQTQAPRQVAESGMVQVPWWKASKVTLVYGLWLAVLSINFPFR